MKLDLKKLQEVERNFQNSPITLSVIERLVRITFENESCKGQRMAVHALIELGVLKDDENKNEEKQHLNS
jgi:hypothetical protein